MTTYEYILRRWWKLEAVSRDETFPTRDAARRARRRLRKGFRSCIIKRITYTTVIESRA